MLTSGSLPGGGLSGAPGPDQQDSSGVSSQDVSSTQEGQTLDELWLLVFLQTQQETGSKAEQDHRTGPQNRTTDQGDLSPGLWSFSASVVCLSDSLTGL